MYAIRSYYVAAVGALYFIGWLALASHVYRPDVLGPTWANIGVGFLFV